MTCNGRKRDEDGTKTEEENGRKRTGRKRTKTGTKTGQPELSDFFRASRRLWDAWSGVRWESVEWSGEPAGTAITGAQVRLLSATSACHSSSVKRK